MIVVLEQTFAYADIQTNDTFVLTLFIFEGLGPHLLFLTLLIFNRLNLRPDFSYYSWVRGDAVSICVNWDLTEVSA